MIDFTSKTDIESHIVVYSALSSAFTDWGRSSGNCVWDLSAINKNGETVSIEVKDRSFPHDKFGDIFAEAAKQTFTAVNYDFDKSYAINVFTDGVIAIASLYDPEAKHFKRLCPKESWGDQKKIYKECISLPQRIKLKKENGKWTKI